VIRKRLRHRAVKETELLAALWRRWRGLWALGLVRAAGELQAVRACERSCARGPRRAEPVATPGAVAAAISACEVRLLQAARRFREPAPAR
jgi:hypothetical protein